MIVVFLRRKYEDTIKVFEVRSEILNLAKVRIIKNKEKVKNLNNKITTTRVSIDTLPTELKNSPQWILWRPIKHAESFAKVPVNKWGDGINFNEAKNWMDFNKASEVRKMTRRRLGLGYVLTGDLLAIALDNCIQEGVIDDWALEIIDYFHSYTEVSTSGKGVTILLKGSLPDGGQRSDNIECYASRRFVAVTGDILQEFEIVRERQKRLNKWYSNTFPYIPSLANIPQNITASRASPSNNEIIEQMFLSKNGQQIELLFHGVIRANDKYNVDLRLCEHIADYTKCILQIDSIFRKSELYRPRWDEACDRGTYGQLVIERALKNQTNYKTEL